MGLHNRKLTVSEATALEGGKIASRLNYNGALNVSIEAKDRLVAIDQNNYNHEMRGALLPDVVIDALANAKNSSNIPLIDAKGVKTPGIGPTDLQNAQGEVRKKILAEAYKAPLNHVFAEELQEASIERSRLARGVKKIRGKASPPSTTSHEDFWSSYQGKKLGSDIVEDFAAQMAADFSEVAESTLEIEEKLNPNKIASNEVRDQVMKRSASYAADIKKTDSLFNASLNERAYITDDQGRKLKDENGNYILSKSNREILEENLALEVIRKNKSRKIADEAFVTPTNPLGINPAEQAFVDGEVSQYIGGLQKRIHEDCVKRAHERSFNNPDPRDGFLQQFFIGSHPVVEIRSPKGRPDNVEIELKEKTFNQTGVVANPVVPGVTYSLAVVDQANLNIEVAQSPEAIMKLSDVAIASKAGASQKAIEHFLEEIHQKTESGMPLDQAVGEAINSWSGFQRYLSTLSALNSIGVPKSITNGMLQNKLGKSFPKIVQAILSNPEGFAKAQINEKIKDKATEKVLKFFGIIQERSFKDNNGVRRGEVNVLTSKPHEIAANVFNKLFLDRIDKQIEEGNFELTQLLGKSTKNKSDWDRVNFLKARFWKKSNDREMLRKRRDEDQGVFAPLISAVTYLIRSGVNKVIYEVAARSEAVRKTVGTIDKVKTFLDNPLKHLIDRYDSLKYIVHKVNQINGILGAAGKGLLKGGIVGVTAFYILGGTPTALVFAGGLAAAQFANSFGRDLVNLHNAKLLKNIPGLFKDRTLLAVDNPFLKFIAGKAGNKISPLTAMKSINVEGRLLSSLQSFNIGAVAAGLVFMFTGSPVGALVTGVGVGAGNYILKQKIAPYLQQSLAELKNAFDITARLNGLPAKLMRFPIIDAIWTGMSINELNNIRGDLYRLSRGEMTADQFNNIYGFGSTFGVLANIGFSGVQTAVGLLTIARFASSAMSLIPGLAGNISIAMNTAKVFSSTNPLGLAVTAIGTVVGFGIGLLTGNMTGALIGAWVGGILGAVIGGAIGNVPGALIGAFAGSAIVGSIGAGIEGWLKDKLGGLYDRAMGLLGAAMGAIALLKATNLKERVEAFVAIGSTMMVMGSAAGALLLAGATFTPGNAAPPISDISVSKRFIGKNEDGSLRFRLTISKTSVDISSADILFKDDINNFTSEVNSIEIIKDTIGVSLQGKSINLPKKTFSGFTTLLTEYDVKLSRPLDQILKEGDNICNTLQGEMVFSIVPADKDKAPKIKAEEVKPETRTFNQTVCVDKNGNELRKSSSRKLFVDNGGLPVEASLGTVTQCSYAIGGGGSHEGYPALDIGAGLGVNVTPILDGTVVLTSYQVNGYGLYIKVLHKTAVGNMITTYAHLSEILVNQGEDVTKTRVIGKVGSTGNSTGPHLHFETNLNGKSVEPCCVINCPSYTRSSLTRAFSCNVKDSAFYSDPRTQCNL